MTVLFPTNTEPQSARMRNMNISIY